MTPLLQMGKPRLRRAKLLGQDLPASKEQSWDSNSGPSGTSLQLQLSTHPVWSADPLSSRGCRGLSGDTSGQPYLALHSNKKTFEMERLPNKEGRLGPEPRALAPCPALIPGTFGICRPGPNKSPSLPARQGICRERIYGQADKAEEAPPLTLLFPL